MTNDASPYDRFVGFIDRYFEENGYHFTLTSLLKDSPEITLLLDGLDEAAKPFPWLIEGIRHYSKKHVGVQIIASSRLTAENLDLLPFFGVTIRPFTDSQQQSFIRGILGGSDSHVADVVLTHLAKFPEIKEVTRNPLLATVLCEIARNNYKTLPRQEARLYEERLDLLLSLYDPAKGISRVESDRIFIRQAAQRIALHLHERSVRAASRDSLLALLTKDFQYKQDQYSIKLALAELRDPCNVLTEMNFRGDLGFGHLRFQEHLVSEELRSLPDLIVKNIGIPWWRGAIYLWSQNARDILWLVKRLDEEGLISKASKTLDKIMSMRGESEVAKIEEIMENAEISRDLLSDLELGRDTSIVQDVDWQQEDGPMPNY
ncbi:MAG: hypothetical protein ABIS50_14915 [Luteolibacter sp.]|uniref:NACHT domain-containing protein n=1 Tax=Luteolibacter sp. TaxID=1962973 RepID=UPI003267BF21